MATVTDYASLTQAIIDFSGRGSLGPFTDYFIQGGEDRIYRKVLELNEGNGLKWMETALTGTINATTGYLAVPADYLALKNPQVVTSSGTFTLTVKEPVWIYDRYPNRTAQGIPSYIARETTNFIFGPFPDSAYTVAGTYYNRATALSGTNTTTWMTTNIPVAFLAACMIECAKFLKDPEGAQYWAGELNDRLSDICLADKAERYSGGTLVMDTA
ncbi:MAG: hypothetical protein KGL39_31105 [Patescibacteria group bacterium]|nr:hypothetical protein [Patescibacteria group bacterium]